MKILQIRLRRACEAGFTLVEMMVSVVVGMLIVASLSMLFANNSRARQEMEKSSQQIENGRYASQFLRDDLRLAGYFGEFSPTSLTVPATPDPSLTDFTSLAAAVPIAVQGYHFGKSATSSIPSGVSALLTDRRSNSDVLVVRRVSTCVSGPTAADPSCTAMNTSNNYYFQTTLCQSQLSTLTAANQFVISGNATVFTTTNANVTASPTYLAQKDCTTPAVTRAFIVRIYYVANNDVSGDGIPTLKMLELGAGSFNSPVPIAEGIETIQLEYGVDTNADGAPDSYAADPIAAGQTWDKVTAVKVHLLARNTQSTPGFDDARQYVLGGTASSDNTFGAFHDTYKRHVYTTVVRLMNVAGRLE